MALLSKGQVVYSGLRKGCLGWFEGLGHRLEVGVNPLGTSIDRPRENLVQIVTV